MITYVQNSPTSENFLLPNTQHLATSEFRVKSQWHHFHPGQHWRISIWTDRKETCLIVCYDPDILKRKNGMSAIDAQLPRIFPLEFVNNRSSLDIGVSWLKTKKGRRLTNMGSCINFARCSFEWPQTLQNIWLCLLQKQKEWISRWLLPIDFLFTKIGFQFFIDIRVYSIFSRTTLSELSKSSRPLAGSQWDTEKSICCI